jgi:hypothetical protein
MKSGQQISEQIRQFGDGAFVIFGVTINQGKYCV